MTNENTQDKPALPSKTFNLKKCKLGLFLDGWSELVEGMGTKAELVRYAVFNDLRGRRMPDIKMSITTGYVRKVPSDKRAYVITQTQPGATTTIYVAEHGQDLYVSWRTYIKPVFNLLVLGIIGLVAYLISFVVGIYSLINGISVSICMFTFIIIFFFGAMLVAMAGLFVRGNPLTFFFVQVNVIDAEDITAMSLSVHKSLLRSLDQAGIDTSKLRIKEKFTGGRKGEDI